MTKVFLGPMHGVVVEDNSLWISVGIYSNFIYTTYQPDLRNAILVHEHSAAPVIDETKITVGACTISLPQDGIEFKNDMTVLFVSEFVALQDQNNFYVFYDYPDHGLGLVAVVTINE